MLKCVKIGSADLQVRTKTTILSLNTEGLFTISKCFSDGLMPKAFLRNKSAATWNYFQKSTV